MADLMHLALTDGDAGPDSENRRALAEFVHRHELTLQRYLRSRACHPDAVQDLSQEVFIRLIRYTDTQGEDALLRLMFRIANNLMTDTWRSARARHQSDHVPITDMELAHDTPSHEREIAGCQRLDQLKLAIGRLPPKTRAVLVFSRFQGLSHAEIARKFGISTKAVEKHIAKALAICREMAGDERS